MRRNKCSRTNFRKYIDKRMFERYNEFINKRSIKVGGRLMKIRGVRIVVLTAFVIVMCFVIGTLFMENKSVVDAKDSREKRFTSIQVKKGDSLWSIAKERVSEEYASIDDYIDEVCETNHIYDQTITEDMYLVVPYYTDIE